MMGSTLAANLSASAVTASTAFLRATASLGLPKVTPRAFAADRACRVRVEMGARSFSGAGRTGQRLDENFSDQEGS